MNVLLERKRLERIAWGGLFIGLFQSLHAAVAWRLGEVEVALMAGVGALICLTIGYGCVRGYVTRTRLERIAPFLSVSWCVAHVGLVLSQVQNGGRADRLSAFLDIFSTQLISAAIIFAFMPLPQAYLLSALSFSCVAVGVSLTGLVPTGALAHLLVLNALLSLLGMLKKDLLQAHFRTQQLDHIAHHDTLTGLQNRRAAELQLQLLKDESQFNVALLDIDHFKTLNDRFGHRAGDQALRHIAQLIRETESSQISGYRWGGEEFMLTLTRMEAGEVENLLQQLLDRIRAPVPGQPWRLTVSVGFALGTERPHLHETVHLADQRLYLAKQSGRDRIVGPEELDGQTWDVEDQEVAAPTV